MKLNKKSGITLLVTTLILGGYFWQQGRTNSAVAQEKKEASVDAAKQVGKEVGKSNNRPVSVTTMMAKTQDYPVRIFANGTVSSLNTVEIRSQITTTVAKVHIQEGQFVKAGELLFTLDGRADQANVGKAEAQLQKDKATLAELQRQLQRSKDLLSKKFIAPSAVDASQSNVDAQLASVRQSEAALNAAKVALSYTKIYAPVSGRTGAINVFPGSLVQSAAGNAPLVTITQMDPIAVSFALPQKNLNDALNGMNQVGHNVTVKIPDQAGDFKGRLHFIDNVVDASSGTVKAKAKLENKNQKLWPGAYVEVEVTVKTLKDVIVLPQNAIIVGVKNKSVYIVGEDGNAKQIPITVTHSFANDVAVQGVPAGAKIVIDGKQNLRPGSPVKERNGDAAEGDKAKSKSATAASALPLASTTAAPSSSASSAKALAGGAAQ